MPIEFKKIIIVYSSYYKYYNEKFDFRPILPISVPVPAMHTSYVGSQKLITSYPFDHVYSLITKIENNEFEFSGYDVVSSKTVRKFYKDLLENGYFEKYLEFLSMLFKINKKEFSETIQNNDNKTIENMLVKRTKKGNHRQKT